MREAGRVVAHALEAVRAAVRPGVSLRELDALGEETIREEGATPSFLGYHPHFAPSPFPGTLCLSPNNVIVHGIPDRYRLREGDLLSIDCGAVVDGYHGDAAVTVPVGEVDEAARRLLATTSGGWRRASSRPGQASGCPTSATPSGRWRTRPGTGSSPTSGGMASAGSCTRTPAC